MSDNVVTHCYLCGRPAGVLPAQKPPVLLVHYECMRSVLPAAPVAPLPQALGRAARGKGRGWRLGERGRGRPVP